MSLRYAHVRRRLSPLSYSLSALLWLAASLLYALRPDALALLTMVPAWLWLLPGLALAGIRLRRKPVAFLWLLWTGFALGYVDEFRPLFHPVAWFHQPQPGEKPAGVFRVVSLNCAGGDPRVAEEVALWQPDLVLLQETPTERHTRALAEQLYGNENACVIGLDTAILGRGITPLIPPPGLRRYAFARVQVGSRQVFVSSIRLASSSLALDLRIQTASRQSRRVELEEILCFLPVSEPILLGGDMNVPAGDGALSPLKARGFSDIFTLAGAGWGNTVENSLPIHRIDQLYCTGGVLAPLCTIAVQSQRSDHRMVVADFRRL